MVNELQSISQEKAANGEESVNDPGHRECFTEARATPKNHRPEA